MKSHALTLNGEEFFHPLQKVVCIGRNYADHAKEMGSEVLEKPMLFLKPATSVQGFSDKCLSISRGYEVHYELEIAVLVGRQLTQASAEKAGQSIVGVGLGLDLTLRDLQRELKSKGHPWEAAKGFDGSCPLSEFVSFDPDAMSLQSLELKLQVNNELRQHGYSRDMVFGIAELISFASTMFTIMPGDVVLTGTPAGVGKLVAGDVISAELLNDEQQLLAVSTSVV